MAVSSIAVHRPVTNRDRLVGAATGIAVAGLTVAAVAIGWPDTVHDGLVGPLGAALLGLPLAAVSCWLLTPQALRTTVEGRVGVAARLAALLTLLGSFGVAAAWLLVMVVEASFAGPFDYVRPILWIIGIGMIGLIIFGIPIFLGLLVPSKLWVVIVRRVLGAD